MIKPFFYTSKLIRRFESELHVAQKQGFIANLTHVKKPRMASAIPEVVGVEIFFSDQVTDETLERLKKYIEQEYKFAFDIETYMEKGKLPKIVYVGYML